MDVIIIRIKEKGSNLHIEFLVPNFILFLQNGGYSIQA